MVKNCHVWTLCNVYKRFIHHGCWYILHWWWEEIFGCQVSYKRAKAERSRRARNVPNKFQTTTTNSRNLLMFLQSAYSPYFILSSNFDIDFSLSKVHFSLKKVGLFYSCPPPPVFWNWNFCRSDQLIQVVTSLNHLLQPAGQFSTRSMIVSDKRHKTQPLMIVAVEFALFSQHLAKLEDSCCTGKMGPPKVEIIWWFECLWFHLNW